MEKKIKWKKIVIFISIIIICVILATVIKLGIDAIIVNKEMQTAQHGITINKDVHLYSSAKETRKYKNLEIGTDTYILNEVIDKSGNKWYKVKVEKKVGYILANDVGKYQDSYNKRDLMVDVSKFNLQNNFNNIGEFKAFLIKNDIKFVYIRVGGRGYGKAGNLYTDPKADEYAKACDFLNIPFGYYFLDEALNSEEIDEEVSFIKNYLNEHYYKNNILPIALDVEKHLEKGRADDIWDKRYELINELVEKLEKENKNVILYSNADLANEYLTNVNAKMWLAYYPKINKIPDYWYSKTNEKCASNKEIIAKLIGWQFTQSGVENNINEKVDLSLVYSNYLLNNSMEDIENDIKENREMVFGPILNFKEKIIEGVENILNK